jgi:hypothetical protein
MRFLIMFPARGPVASEHPAAKNWSPEAFRDDDVRLSVDRMIIVFDKFPYYTLQSYANEISAFSNLA